MYMSVRWLKTRCILDGHHWRHLSQLCDMVRAMSDASRSWSRAALVLILYLALASAGIAWSSLRGDESVWKPSGRENPQMFLGIVAGLLIGLGFVFASRYSAHRFEWGRALHRDLRALLGPLSGLEIIIMAVASAIGEEIFFRGALLPVVGLWASSAIFALLHIGPKVRFLPWTISSFIAGMMFGQLFLWAGDLSGPVVAHFTVNALNLRYLSNTDLR
jgi:membrane protease YdiL (CAAX protease family)